MIKMFEFGKVGNQNSVKRMVNQAYKSAKY